MAEYPDGREQLDAFSLSVGSEKRRIECYVFGRSIRIHRSILHCEDSQEVKLTYSVGITEKTSETSEDSIESRLGAKGIAAITSRMRMTLNTEVNWSRVRTTETTRLCKAPRCGRYEFRVYQSIREYEFFFFRRGRRPFRHDVWDLETQRPVTEYVEDYDYLPLELEFDETCRDRPHCAAAPRTSPDYDGMASVNLGKDQAQSSIPDVRGRPHRPVRVGGTRPSGPHTSAPRGRQADRFSSAAGSGARAVLRPDFHRLRVRHRHRNHSGRDLVRAARSAEPRSS